SGTGTTISGGTMSNDGNYCLFVVGVPEVSIIGVTFIAPYNGGISDYGVQSNNVYIAYCNFTGVSGTKVSLTNCLNVTYYMNIGYP
ncbi:hypothetical protein MUP77_19840, partial [Candidatus Bathyarchaeota archaeon]|nr:hypothetical protein [Candidatus Bathyarchaeota archaeon]